MQPSLSNNELRDAQMADATMTWLLVAKGEGKECPPWEYVAHMSPASETYWSYWDQLLVQEGVLHQRWESDNGDFIRWRLVVPEKYRHQFIDDLHGGKLGGHFGLKTTLAHVKQ